MFRYFENRVDPDLYGERVQQPGGPCGLSPFILAMTLLIAPIVVFQAALFFMLGRVVRWLDAAVPARQWAENGSLWGRISSLFPGFHICAALAFFSLIQDRRVSPFTQNCVLKR